MAYCRPAGYSDDEDDDDDDDFELSTDYDREENYRPMYFEEPVSKENIFYTALKSGDVVTMKNMLDSGFAVDQPLSGGWSPLMNACSLGLLPVVELLIGARANVNFHKELFTPLMALCKSSSQNEDELLKCFDILVSHGANINAIDRNACTALMYACTSGHFKLVRKLMDCKCNVNIQDVEGWSALFHAVNEGREEIIVVLLEGKARVDLIDRRRRSAFDLAMEKGYEDLGKLVCSKKEKRRLLEQDESLSKPDETGKDPVEELMKQLPKPNAKSISGFPADITKFLWAMGLGHYSKLFVAHDMQLNEFLLITDDRLKELGVRFSVHRKRILASVRKFHLHQWNKASLGLKPRNQQMDMEDGVKLMCNVTKHLHVLNASVNYLRIHQQPGPLETRAFEMCENAIHQVNLIGNELNAIAFFCRHLEAKEKIEPVDLIKPKNEPQSYVVPIITTTVLIGIVLWNRRINIISKFLQS